MAERRGLPETVLLDEILAGQALPGLMQPDGYGGRVYVPRLALRGEHHRPDCRRRSWRGAVVSRRVLVTGAASGIGLATARAFAAGGAQVLGLDVAALPSDIEGVTADVSDADSVRVAVDEAAARLGGFDCLVNCAGVEYDAALGELVIPALDKMLAINLRGPILVTHFALPHFAEASCIVNIASELAYLGRAGASRLLRDQGAQFCRSPGPGRASSGRASASMPSHRARSTRRC